MLTSVSIEWTWNGLRCYYKVGRFIYTFGNYENGLLAMYSRYVTIFEPRKQKVCRYMRTRNFCEYAHQENPRST
jgi:hypothetical protein